MSHSQFHCTGRAYLDMHGLIFETSICYWQDQPGRGKNERGGERQTPREGATRRDDDDDDDGRAGERGEERGAARQPRPPPPPRDRRRRPPTPPTTASHRPSPAGLAGTPARREERRGGAVDRTRRTRVRHPHPRRWLQRGHPRGSGNGGGPADPTRSPGSTRRSRDTRPPQHHAVQGPGEARTRARERPRDGGGRSRAPPAAAKAQRRHPRGPLAVTRGRGREPERGAGRDRDPPAATRPPPTSARRARPPSRSRRGVGVEGRGPLPAPPTPAGGGGTPRRRRRRRPTPRRDRVGPRPTSRRAPALATRGNTRPSERGGAWPAPSPSDGHGGTARRPNTGTGAATGLPPHRHAADSGTHRRSRTRPVYEERGHMGRRREDGEGTVKREGAPLRAKTRRGRGESPVTREGARETYRGRTDRARPGTRHGRRSHRRRPQPGRGGSHPPADTPETRHTAGDAPVRAPGRAPPRSRDPTPHRSLRSRQRAPPTKRGSTRSTSRPSNATCPAEHTSDPGSRAPDEPERGWGKQGGATGSGTRRRINDGEERGDARRGGVPSPHRSGGARQQEQLREEKNPHTKRGGGGRRLGRAVGPPGKPRGNPTAHKGGSRDACDAGPTSPRGLNPQPRSLPHPKPS